MNEKKAKKLRRSLMPHDEWLKEKSKRTYIFTEFDARPKRGMKVLFRTADNDVQIGIISHRFVDAGSDRYEIKVGENKFIVTLEAIKPTRIARALDKISLYKEMKRKEVTKLGPERRNISK